MKISSKQYALALFESLQSTQGNDQDLVLDNFAAVLSQTAHNDEITVLIPDVESWDGLRVDGLTIEGRLWKDLKRVVDPYLDTLLARAKCKVHIRHAAG